MSRTKTVKVVDIVDKPIVTQEDYDAMFRTYKILDYQEKEISIAMNLKKCRKLLTDWSMCVIILLTNRSKI